MSAVSYFFAVVHWVHQAADSRFRFVVKSIAVCSFGWGIIRRISSPLCTYNYYLSLNDTSFCNLVFIRFIE